MNSQIKILYFIILLVGCHSLFAQKINLQIESINDHKERTILYESTNNSIELSELTKTIDKSIDSLKKQGFFNVKVEKIYKRDSLNYNATLVLNDKYDNLYIYSLNEMVGFKDKKVKIIDGKPYFIVRINEIENFLSDYSLNIVKEGYPFSKIKLINIKKYDSENLYADLQINLNHKRSIDKIEIKGYENFPKSFLKQYLKYSNSESFNLEKIVEKSKQINNLGFVRQTKDPEVLFKKDSTYTYLYLEKKKNNSFDGFIGFATNEESNKLELDGYLNLRLHNTLNYGEELNINYRSTNNKDRFLQTEIKAPFVFSSPLGLELNLNLTKKDSSYTKDEQSVGINYITKKKHTVSLHISSLNSVSNLNEGNESIKDYNSSFKKIKYEFNRYNYNDKLTPVKFLNRVELSVGTRKDNTESKDQIKYNTRTFNNFNISKSSSIYLNIETYGLISDNYYLNEMMLFGGINSIRGFEENSIATNKLILINTEYRLKLDSNIYINTIFDTAYYEDALNDLKEHIYGIGLGLNINTNSGIFRINYANGLKKGGKIDLKLSKIHVSFSNMF